MTLMTDHEKYLWDKFIQVHNANPLRLFPGQIVALRMMGLGGYIPEQESSYSPSASTQMMFRMSEMDADADSLSDSPTLPSKKADNEGIFEHDETLRQRHPLFEPDDEYSLNLSSSITLSDEPTARFFHSSARTAPSSFQEGTVPENSSGSKTTVRHLRPHRESFGTLAAYSLAASVIFFGGAIFGAYTLTFPHHPKTIVVQKPSLLTCPPPLPAVPSPCPTQTTTIHPRAVVAAPPVRAKKKIHKRRPRHSTAKPAYEGIEIAYKFRVGGLRELRRTASTCKIVPDRLLDLPANVFVRDRLAHGIEPPKASYMRLFCPTDKIPQLEGETVPIK